jgi:PAS domain S-box-containing protein
MSDEAFAAQAAELRRRLDELRRHARSAERLDILARELGPLAAGHDVEQAETVSAALRASEERFRVLFEHSPDAIMLIDPHDPDGLWPIVDCNEAACRMNGYTREEIVGQSIDLFNPGPGFFDAGASHLDRVRAAGMLQAEDIQRRKDGSLFYTEYTSTLITLDGRELILGIDRDITARKQAEAELRAAKEEAERANRAKSDFLSRMSHELRTPLNAILGFGNYLESELTVPEHREYLDYIVKSGEYLLTLINDVLDISRIEADRLLLTLQPVDLAQAIDDALRFVYSQAIAHRITLVVAPDIPDALYVTADPQRLKQVMVNLLSNAIKYNRPSGKVTLGVEVGDGHARLAVTDTGAGIPPTLQAKLFTPFERLGAERTGVDGVGLGLALARQLVELMGGRIGVESAEGIGSTFHVDMPLALVMSS